MPLLIAAVWLGAHCLTALCLSFLECNSIHLSVLCWEYDICNVLRTCLTPSMCSENAGYYYSRRGGKGTQSNRRQGRDVTCPIKVSRVTELSLRTVFAKANNTMLPYNDSLGPLPPNLSASVSSVKGLFYSLSSLPKTFGTCTKEEIWNFGAAISRKSKPLFGGFPCSSPQSFGHSTSRVFEKFSGVLGSHPVNFIRTPESATFENTPIHAKNIYRSSHFQTKGYSSLPIIFKLKQKGNHCKVLLNLVIWSATRAGKPKSLRFWSISFRSVYFQYLKQTFRSWKESKQATRTLAKCSHTLAVATLLSPSSETTAAAGPWFCFRELQSGMTALPSTTLPGRHGGSEQSSVQTADLQLRPWSLLSGSGSLSLLSSLTTPQPPPLDREREHMGQAATASLSCRKGE